MTDGLLDRLARGPVLGDGGYLIELERRGHVQAGPYTPEVSILDPGALAGLHREFLHAGAEVLQALTFYASEEKLATVGLADRADEINRAAVRIARSVAAEVGALVAGNLSLSWSFDPADSASPDRVREQFDRQLDVQVGEGIDLVVAETFSWLGEALIAVERAKRTGLPVVATMAFEHPEARSYEGVPVAVCARRLVDAGADVVGVNCLRDPERTLPLVRAIRAALPNARIAAQPAAFRVTDARPDYTAGPAFPFGLDPLTLTRGEMAAWAGAARDAGVGYIGSCCGSAPHHVRAMARALGKGPTEERRPEPRGRPMSMAEDRRATRADVVP